MTGIGAHAVYQIASMLKNPEHWTAYTTGLPLRPYQLQPFSAIARSVRKKQGDTFILKFARQSGKDETLAQLITFLLLVFSHRDNSIIYASPTFKPQTITAMHRLEARLSQNIFTRPRWKRRAGYIYQVGEARAEYFSGEPTANVVGATATLLLVINEAQDILPAIYDKRFAPMAAANNATKVFAGTAWTSDSLLEREAAAAAIAENNDGRRRLFIVDADEVSKAAPAYGEFIQGEIKRMGRQHPLVRTQYYCETIDAQAGMFPAARLANIAAYDDYKNVGNPIAYLIDVAGQDEATNDPEGIPNPGRDSTTLTIAACDLSSLPSQGRPTYHVTNRREWTGANHLTIFEQICTQAEQDNPTYFVIDASGVGEGLYALLAARFGEKVIPVKFSAQKKSEIGWGFISIIETGRFQDHCHTRIVSRQYALCKSQILPGPQKLLRWGVPDGTRDPETSELTHDDFLLADSLTAILDSLVWAVTTDTTILPSPDPIDDMERAY